MSVSQQTAWNPLEGRGLLRQLLRVVDPSWVLLVTGKKSYALSGAEKFLKGTLCGHQVVRVSDFENNPKGSDLRRLLGSLKRSSPPEFIIAIGGGSVIDIAKLLKAFWKSSAPLSGYLEKREELEVLEVPFVAIPTTAGSGSEATHFAVVYEGEQKYSIADEALLPSHALLDPCLLRHSPRRVSAAAALDAFCQGVESYWSIYSTEESRRFASEAIQGAWAHMLPAVLDDKDSAWEGLSQAAYQAGQAINLTKTTAPHAVSYALSFGFDVMHGHAVALLGSVFFNYNYQVNDEDCLDPRGAIWVRERLNEILKMIDLPSLKKYEEVIRERIAELGLESSLSQLGITRAEDLSWIVDNGFNPQRVDNNPRKLNKKDLSQLLNELS